MKKLILLTGFILMGFLGFAQSFTVYPSPASVSGLASEPYFEAVSHVENNTSNELTLYWERIVNDIPADWNSSMCDNSQCYVPQVYLMDFTIGVGDESILDVRFYPAGLVGEGEVEVLVYDPTDSLNTVVSHKYYGTATLPTDVEDLVEENFKVYPNPATDYIILPQNNSAQQAAIYNIAGQQIRLIDLQNGTERINISDLNRGLYLVQFLDKNKKKLHTTRLTKR